LSRLIFIGASTGGTEALKDVLVVVPANCPPILVVQHMPATFTGSFAKRLHGLCQPTVVEAAANMPVRAGTVYIAPGSAHLRIRAAAGGYVTDLDPSGPINRHMPSVDALFRSAASVVGRNAVGVILTGMGKDGADGLLAMRQAGARTLGQDEASCVVYGMPREAALIGAVEEVVPLGSIAGRMLAMAAAP
jgi:two-component system chemotaxis response regulator CheB